MRSSRFTEEQIIAILKEQEAGAMLDNAMLKDIAAKMVTPAARREAVAHLRTVHGVSQRRACRVLGADRSSVRYRARVGDDGAVRARMRELAAERRRFGYRRLHWLLGREGVAMNHKKFRRLYREERLQVRRRGGRKRALGPGRRWCCRRGGTSDGPSTSSATPSPTVGASGSWRSSMTTRGNVWPWSRTPPCPARGWRASWTPRSPGEAGPQPSSPTTAPSSPAWRSCGGARSAGSPGTTSRPASRNRTHSPRASSGGCETSA